MGCDFFLNFNDGHNTKVLVIFLTIDNGQFRKKAFVIFVSFGAHQNLGTLIFL